MRKIALALTAGLLAAGCSGSPTASPRADAVSLPARFDGFTMGSGNRTTPIGPDTTDLNRDAATQTAPALDAEADSTALERGGFTMGSGN